jgi:hypothetical protein
MESANPDGIFPTELRLTGKPAAHTRAREVAGAAEPDPGAEAHYRQPSQQSLHDHFFGLAKGMTISRAPSMKSCATGFIVRFFKVTIPTG